MTKLEKLHTFLFNTENPTVAQYKEIVEELSGLKLPDSCNDFYIQPASTKFHGVHICGLARHSLFVYYYALKLAPAFNMKEEDIDPIACIFHDLCKVGMYDYDKHMAYTPKVSSDYITIQHGPETLRRLFHLGLTLSKAWEFAVAYHMGSFGLGPDAQRDYSKAVQKYPEVLLLHTADMMASQLSNE